METKILRVEMPVGVVVGVEVMPTRLVVDGLRGGDLFELTVRLPGWEDAL